MRKHFKTIFENNFSNHQKTSFQNTKLKNNTGLILKFVGFFFFYKKKKNYYVA